MADAYVGPFGPAAGCRGAGRRAPSGIPRLIDAFSAPRAEGP